MTAKKLVYYGEITGGQLPLEIVAQEKRSATITIENLIGGTDWIENNSLASILLF